MNVLDIIDRFQIKEKVVGYDPLGNGHINSTFLIKTDTEKRYVLQKINTNVFKSADQLMNNIYLVTNYLLSRGYETLEVIKTKDNKLYLENSDGAFRVYSYIDNAICYEGVSDSKIVYNSAKAFGTLHKSLRDFDISSLEEVIPNFHNTSKRYNDFLKTVKEDACGRVKDCQKEIDSIISHSGDCSLLVDSIKDKSIKVGVVHNDPKINNVLFDKNTGNVRAVIDLDTVMPGSYLYDYGDALRSLFTGEYEDSLDLSKISVNYQVFEAYTKGYLSEMKDVLNQKEINLLAFSIYLLAYELAIRFITDYLQGDIYYKTAYPEHNLVRARTQLKLANEIYNHLPELNEIANRIYEEIK